MDLDALRVIVTSDSVDAERGMDRLKGKVDDVQNAFQSLGQALAAGAVALGLKTALDAFGQQEVAAAKLEAVLNATGGAAGLTTRQMGQLATSLQKTTRFGDELVLNAQAILSTFKKINEATFEDALRAAADMAEVMGQDLNSATLMVGKALNDPIVGLQALTRTGVQFTESQKAQIQALVESNDFLSAQTIILRELNTQFGGAAERIGNTLPGQLTKMNNALGDAQELIGQGLAPTVGVLADALKGIGEVANLIPAPIMGAVSAFGAVVVAAPGVSAAIRAISLAMGTQGLLGLLTGPVGIIALLVAAGVALAGFLDQSKKAEELNRRLADGTATANEYALAVEDTRAQLERLREGYALIREQNGDDPFLRREIEQTERRLTSLGARLSEMGVVQAQAALANARAAKALEDQRLAAERTRAALERFNSDRERFFRTYVSDLAQEAELKADILRIEEMMQDRTGGLPNSTATMEILRLSLAGAKAELEDLANSRAWETLQRNVEMDTPLAMLRAPAIGSDLMGSYRNQTRGLRKALAEGLLSKEEAEVAAAEARRALIESLLSADSLTEAQEAALEMLLPLVKADQAKARARDNLATAFEALEEVFGGANFENLFKSFGIELDDSLGAFIAQNKDAFLTLASTIKDSFGSVFDFIKDASTAALEAEVSNLEAGLKAHDDYYERQLDARERLGQDTVDFELQAAEDRARIARDLARKKHEIELKEFISRKIGSLSEIAINTSVAVTKVLPNFPLAMLVGALGAIQGGTALAQQPPPPPALFDGGLITGSTSGSIIRAGERNQSELILPLRKDKLRDLGLSGGGISVGSIQINGSSGDPQAMVEEFLVELRKKQRQGEFAGALN